MFSSQIRKYTLFQIMNQTKLPKPIISKLLPLSKRTLESDKCDNCTKNVKGTLLGQRNLIQRNLIKTSIKESIEFR